jgi:hypothetical protein
MFNSIITNKKIRKATLEELDLPSQIKLYFFEESKKDIGLKDNWIAGYTDKFLMCGSFITEYIIDTPVFTNLQWILTTTDYPDGELAALFYLGTLRSEKKIIMTKQQSLIYQMNLIKRFYLREIIIQQRVTQGNLRQLLNYKYVV